MSSRPIVALAAIAVVLTGLAVAATLRWIIPQADIADFVFAGGTDQAALDEYFAWVNSGWIYYAQVPWLVLAALVAGLAALALAAYRVLLGPQAAGTRTVSAPASTSVRNPMTTPKSSPSSSNSSARSSRTSNVDAFK